jgi:hypothetical protein
LAIVQEIRVVRDIRGLLHLPKELRMTKKSKTPAPQPTRRWSKYRVRTLLLVLIATAAAIGVYRWPFHGLPSRIHTLPEVLASSKCHGFELVQGPDRPGPYEDLEPNSGTSGEPLSGSVWANGKSCRYNVAGVPGEEFRAVGLIPQDGGPPTYIVLKRRAAPASPARQSGK